MRLGESGVHGKDKEHDKSTKRVSILKNEDSKRVTYARVSFRKEIKFCT